jgi:hypothetical protein
MTQAEAWKAIMREWFALPASKRRTQDQTAAFAMAKAAKYRFRSKADRYQVIKGWLQNSLEPSH